MPHKDNQIQQDNNYNIGNMNNNNMAQNNQGMIMPNINLQPEMNMMPSNNFNNMTPIQPMVQDNNNFVGQSNFNQNNTTIPQPINVIPTPQPISPQPIMQNNMNEQPMMQPNFNNQMFQPEQQAQVETMNQPINFVYGPQNNNQNMQ